MSTEKKMRYRENKAPADYTCSKCGADGVKLWRKSQTTVEDITLMCCRCAAKDQDKSIAGMLADGRRPCSRGGFFTDQIGEFFPAVPTEGCDTYWGYTSVPDEGVRWWRGLLNLPEHCINDG